MPGSGLGSEPCSGPQPQWRLEKLPCILGGQGKDDKESKAREWGECRLGEGSMESCLHEVGSRYLGILMLFCLREARSGFLRVQGLGLAGGSALSPV